jgi:two-component system cell cycle response regulator DivK
MSKRILIVEDNDLNLKLFRDLLTAHGYETIETREGLEAVALTRNERPDLILMDIQLPEISGLDVTRQLKAEESLRSIPIIAVTAFAMKDDEEKILAAGCQAYISKPISIVPFLNTVRKFLGEQELLS